MSTPSFLPSFFQNKTGLNLESLSWVPVEKKSKLICLPASWMAAIPLRSFFFFHHMCSCALHTAKCAHCKLHTFALSPLFFFHHMCRCTFTMHTAPSPLFLLRRTSPPIFLAARRPRTFNPSLLQLYTLPFEQIQKEIHLAILAYISRFVKIHFDIWQIHLDIWANTFFAHLPHLLSLLLSWTLTQSFSHSQSFSAAIRIVTVLARPAASYTIARRKYGN